MSALLNPRPARPRFHHATQEEYGAFVRQRRDIRSGSNLLGAYRRFVRHYPDLDEWFRAPLAERVGERKTRSGQAYVSALARPYLYYLALRGEVAFDREWIIAVGCHVLPQELLPPAVFAFIRESAERAVRLGYGRKSVTAKLSRAMKALYLHRLTAGVTEADEADIAGFERAVIAFGERPDVAKFFASAEAYRRTAKGYRQALYTLRVVLYHRGGLPAPPERTEVG